MSKSDEGTAKLPIVISQGEPSGIGPEVAVKAFSVLNGAIGGRPLRLIGGVEVFRRAARFCGLDWDRFADAVIDTGAAPGTPGTPAKENAGHVTAAIAEGVRACNSGEAAALVTAPIHKAVLAAAGFGFPGHTEYLGHLVGVARPVMMLASRDLNPPLRVVPFTVHVPLHDVFRLLDTEELTAVGHIVFDSLVRDFGCANPRLAVAGLNPHAGESGTMGREDLDIVAPMVGALRAHGRDAVGPLSADTLFHAEARKTYDAVLCMYHDQALIPLKTLAFWDGVNVTLGLPIVRTSPDHGTALAIAGQGIANEASMVAAIKTAAEIAERRGL